MSWVNAQGATSSRTSPTAVSACVVIKTTDDATLTLRVFDRVVHAIAEKSADISPRDLLFARPFGMHFEDGIIRSIR